MRGTCVGRAYTDPFRIEPEIGKVAEYTVKSPESRSAGSVRLSQQSRFVFHFASGVR